MDKFDLFIQKYNNPKLDLVSKLGVIHEYVNNLDKSELIESIRNLINYFNSDKLHQSELKTILVISKPFREYNSIKKIREDLLNTYTKIKNG